MCKMKQQQPLTLSSPYLTSNFILHALSQLLQALTTYLLSSAMTPVKSTSQYTFPSHVPHIKNTEPGINWMLWYSPCTIHDRKKNKIKAIAKKRLPKANHSRAVEGQQLASMSWLGDWLPCLLCCPFSCNWVALVLWTAVCTKSNTL